MKKILALTLALLLFGTAAYASVMHCCENGDIHDYEVLDLIMSAMQGFDDIKPTTKLIHIGPELSNWQEDETDKKKWDLFISELAHGEGIGFFQPITPEEFVNAVMFPHLPEEWADQHDTITLQMWRDYQGTRPHRLAESFRQLIELPEEPTEPPTEEPTEPPTEPATEEPTEPVASPDIIYVPSPYPVYVPQPYPVYMPCEQCEAEYQHGHKPGCSNSGKPWDRPNKPDRPKPTEPPTDIPNGEISGDIDIDFDAGGSGCDSGFGIMALGLGLCAYLQNRRSRV